MQFCFKSSIKSRKSILLYKIAMEAAIFYLPQAEIEKEQSQPAIREDDFDTRLEETGYFLLDNLAVVGFAILRDYGGSYVTRKGYEQWRKSTKASWSAEDFALFEEFLIRRYTYFAWL